MASWFLLLLLFGLAAAAGQTITRTTDEANLFILLYNLMSKLCKYYKLILCLRNFRAEDVSQRCPAPRELIS